MTTRDHRFLPSLALALAVHALLLLLLSRALAHQVFEVPGPVLDLQLTSGASPVPPRVAGPAAVGAPRTPTKPGPTAAAPAAPRPTRVVPPPEVPAPRPASPGGDSASSSGSTAAAGPEPAAPEAVAAPVAAAAPAAAAAGSGSSVEGPAESGAPGGSPGVDESLGGGPGYGSTAAGGGGGAAAFKADIDPVLVQTIQVSYPKAARRSGQEGMVRILAEVGTDGTVISEEVYSSSGHRLLDSAALEAVKKAQFLPALKNGRPVIARILVPIRFRLTD